MAKARTIRGEATERREPEWMPLLKTVGDRLVGDFMWMYEVELSDGTPLQVYKHIDTRRSVHLTPDGEAFIYENGRRYRPFPVADVLAAVFWTLPRLAGVTEEQVENSRAAVERLRDGWRPYTNEGV